MNTFVSASLLLGLLAPLAQAADPRCPPPQAMEDAACAPSLQLAVERRHTPGKAKHPPKHPSTYQGRLPAADDQSLRDTAPVDPRQQLIDQQAVDRANRQDQIIDQQLNAEQQLKLDQDRIQQQQMVPEQLPPQPQPDPTLPDLIDLPPRPSLDKLN